MSTKHQCNQLTKKNSRSCRSVEILFRCTERRNISEKLRRTQQQSSAFPKRQLLFTVWPPKKAGSKPVRSQARPRGSEAHRMRRREPSSSTIVKIQRHKRMALLRGSFTLEEETRYKLDEEAPLTTPVDASVLRYCHLCFERAQFKLNLSGNRKSFFRKREKAKAFSFSIKEIYLSLSLVSILQ